MKRTLTRQFALAAAVLLGSLAAWGADTSMLRPPKGSKVAIIVFEDLECPDCARAAPLLHEAAKQYNVPLVQHDFPLPQHAWSFEAAVNARYFDTKSLKLGDEYRLYIFQNQMGITKQNLRGITERFADEHKVALPFVVDPEWRSCRQGQGRLSTRTAYSHRSHSDHIHRQRHRARAALR